MRSGTRCWGLIAVSCSCFAGLLVVTGSAAQAVTIEWVTVGDPGNAADTTGYGAVAYTYRIGKCEVTNAQYAEFLNAVAATDTYELYSTYMADDFPSRHGGITRSGGSGSYTYSAIEGHEALRSSRLLAGTGGAGGGR